MSFILDALRKSEAARRRSETPDLFASMPAAREPVQVRASWPLWLLGTVAAISLLALLWLLAQRAPEALDTTEAPEAPPASSSVGVKAETASIDNIAAIAPTSAPVPAPIPPRSSPPMGRTPLPTATATAIPSPAIPLPPMRDPPAQSPEPAIVATQPTMPPAGSVASLADLDPATRKLLPPLKLSMHLWNETPAQRFVILDGQRLREGDVLGDLVVERITRDGAVVVWRGGQLKIEVR